jgi:hypothetical protein
MDLDIFLPQFTSQYNYIYYANKNAVLLDETIKNKNL